MTFAHTLFDAPPTPRQAGEAAAQACAARAEREGFDAAAAGRVMLDALRLHGELTGEDLSDAALAAGHVPHDHRAFGKVIRQLSVRRQIKGVGYAQRRKGHGTGGAVVWAIQEKP